MNIDNCPFCKISTETILTAGSYCVAMLDQFPISPGHTLIIPRRHADSFFELTQEERTDMLALLDPVKSRLDAEHHPSGYNIGLNEGSAAGQTIMHVHLHVIPRYDGDQVDPRGGIRLIFPGKTRYWEDD